MENTSRWSLAYAACAALFSAMAFSQVSSIDKLATVQWRFCPEAILERPIEVPIEWVPVGCEAVDCCPGCPGILEKIDWRIRVEGAPLESVQVEFENLPQQNALRLRNAAFSATDGPIVVGRGETVISGLPATANDERPAVGKLSFRFDEQWLKKRVADAQSSRDAPDGEDDFGDGSVTIEQFRGKYLVNEYKLKYRIPLCWFPPPLSDRIVHSANATLDSTSTYLDGRRAIGCVNDEKRRGAGTIFLGNVLQKNNCRAETVVFSDDDAMRLVENVNVWTNAIGDVQPISLTPNLLKAPVTVWNLRPGLLSGLIPALDILNANNLYNSNNSGIGFTSEIRNVSADPAAIATIGTGCANAPAVLGSAFFIPGRLNVYYVNAAFTGVNCGASRNIQYVGTTSNNQTLAHEFGHSMSLDHTNGLAGFAANNVMVGGGQNRTHFSDGQSFRMNAHCSSTLNVNGVRTGPVRRCNSTIGGNVSCPGADSHCLPVEIDQLPK
jgi:hypothetical protein